MALVEGVTHGKDGGRKDADVVLGDDWVAPDKTVESEVRSIREKRGLFSLNRSPLTRKIITFNLVALNFLVAGILFLNSSRDTLAEQKAEAVRVEAELIANVFEVQALQAQSVNLGTGEGVNVADTLDTLEIRPGLQVFVFDAARFLVGNADATAQSAGLSIAEKPTVISDFLLTVWSSISAVFRTDTSQQPLTLEDILRRQIEETDPTQTRIERSEGPNGETIFTALSPIEVQSGVAGTIALVSFAPQIDAAVRLERESVLQMFVIATLVSIGLSLVLASTISNPISNLADAAEVGRDRHRRNVSSGRIRIPDLTARPDEIGRLSGALRGMVAALYDRIDANEQFAADVAHEIKNPLASLRSAVGTLRLAKRPDQVERLLDVIDHDVRRLDRLVSDISNASRLDSELVKEEEAEFNLLDMLKNLSQFLGEDAKRRGIEFISDLPDRPIMVHGLEARLAQVFVNLITNAVSFCEDGDAIRIWARRRENRVLVVVEDTGPGIPDEALTKIFKRFYSQRPETDFGNNSGLGLAISKQIVEAHGGVIWAENIRPTEADATSEPLGARFVVGLPL
ncbi:sensor histidine kinase [Marivita cryptomonadis]|uniref:histidine kinase n=2 Tax=Marivita cryptomonadis TaxID=505252 RepID=A0A9Q2S135_9RHOB|nr:MULTISPECIES: sensor histidine kinase [Marivita]MCR9168143.1 sensor histidine kinase [Paracoccaceae bacterium]MBM2323092.1 sensor histidine kinase [Marivita cryptomonadis]MBM2332675.1 sensor histidine kinase [Marivita cryptomonadis]MBM2342258.1 sensor histidine kinase [Marivita cryptomonadis]MBM2346923.1 sensor histidine kinase [Marivita cryptomonadis]